MVARLLAQRGLTDPQAARAFLDPSVYQPTSPYELPNLEHAVDRLRQALAGSEQIAVWGDFDVDGQTATTLLVQGLRMLGGQVVYYIPNRARESHGVNLSGLEQVIDAGARVVLTCDTGITALEAADYARQRGVDFIVTDHHDLPETLPAATVLVNPKFLPAGHPLGALPGVGVAYKLMEALLAQAGRADAAEELLDLVALGIVADLAEQTGDTRFLLQRGLPSLRGTTRLGLLNLIELAELQREHLTEEHISFALAPRLNALGRLGNANLGVELLTTSDAGRARLLASHLEGLNTQRKLLTDQVFQGVMGQIQRDPASLNYAVLVFANPDWPAGVIGIVASRIVEHYHKPVILFSAPPGGTARGSARSIPGVNITAAIAAQAGLLHGFGGHPMAAGLALDTERIGEFHAAVSRTVAAQTRDLNLEATLQIDAVLPLGKLSLELVDALDILAPFGPGNPPLAFASQPLSVAGSATIGRTGEHLQVQVRDQHGESYRVLWWQGAGWELPDSPFELAYTAHTSNYRGQRQLEITWEDARLVQTSAISVAAPPQRELVDCRSAVDPSRELAALDLPAQTQLWAEGLLTPPAGYSTRSGLEPAPALVIYTCPPSQAVLQAALAQATPQVVYLFGVDPALDAPQAFLERLAGLVKHALRAKNGRTRLDSLAAALGHRTTTVAAGLDWLQARGQIHYNLSINGLLEIEAAGKSPRGDREVLKKLHSLLEETRAYRAYYRRAALQSFTDL
ncbi:MAG: single-stranded-DNA-specific exonuclease RecJ [Anaerolineales bacterium]